MQAPTMAVAKLQATEKRAASLPPGKGSVAVGSPVYPSIVDWCEILSAGLGSPALRQAGTPAATTLAVAKLCDGVVVGSRIVQEIEGSTEKNVVANVSKLVRELRQAVDKA